MQSTRAPGLRSWPAADGALASVGAVMGVSVDDGSASVDVSEGLDDLLLPDADSVLDGSWVGLLLLLLPLCVREADADADDEWAAEVLLGLTPELILNLGE